MANQIADKIVIYDANGTPHTYNLVDNTSGYLKTVPMASASQLGGVKVDGQTIGIDANGTIKTIGGISYTVLETWES